MSKQLLTAASVLAFALAGASAAQAQVAMFGEYHESNGVVVNIPQNPPKTSCVYGGNDARCMNIQQGVNNPPLTTGGLPPASWTPFETQTNTSIMRAAPLDVNNERPSVGVRGYGTAMAGLAVGDPIDIPVGIFQQDKGLQVGEVLNNIVILLETSFTIQVPTATRDQVGVTTMTFTPRTSVMNTGQTAMTTGGGTTTFTTTTFNFPTSQAFTVMYDNVDVATNLTNRFSQMNWSVAAAAGGRQNNAHTALFTTGGGTTTMTTMGANVFQARAAADTTVTRSTGQESLVMRYNAGPREFGGTMALLLDGAGRLYLAGPGLDGAFPPGFPPIVGTNPVGDNIDDVPDNVRNAAGWNYTVPGRQGQGLLKAFGPAPQAILGNTWDPPVATFCGTMAPPSPPGCNQVVGFDTVGLPVAPLASARSTKHMFAWTTGTISIGRKANRPSQGGQLTDLVTAMGYDTVVGTGTTARRNVGLVAGSYTLRLDGTGNPTQINTQMAGMNLSFVPEPGTTMALVAGLGLLGAAAVRRRRA